jgi:hypothetical protein
MLSPKNTARIIIKTNVHRLFRLWSSERQSLSRMGLYRVIVAAVQNGVFSLNFNNKRSEKESDRRVFRAGPTESLDILSFREHERMDFQEFHCLASSAVKLLIDLEFRGSAM